MKKTLAAIAVVAMVFFATSAMAAGVKMPKEMCIAAEGSPNSVFCLAVKSTGSVKFADNQKLKHYTITGSFYNNGQHQPIGGTGYIDGILFRFHISGQFMGSAQTHHSVEGYVNLMLEPATGSMSGIFTSAGNPVGQETYSLLQVPCSDVSAPDALPAATPAVSMYGK